METFSPKRFLTRPAALLAVTAAFLSLDVTAAQRSGFRQVAAQSMLRGHQFEPLAADAMRPAERAFLDKALANARLQNRLAELGASQATSTEVRSHAESLKSDGRQMVESITGLIQKKAAGSPATVAEPASDTYTALAGRASGEFDREFVRVLADLHDATITMFEQAAADLKDADVREMAAAQLPMLRAHRGRILELKKSFD